MWGMQKNWAGINLNTTDSNINIRVPVPVLKLTDKINRFLMDKDYLSLEITMIETGLHTFPVPPSPLCRNTTQTPSLPLCYPTYASLPPAQPYLHHQAIAWIQHQWGNSGLPTGAAFSPVSQTCFTACLQQLQPAKPGVDCALHE